MGTGDCSDVAEESYKRILKYISEHIIIRIPKKKQRVPAYQ